MPVFETGAFNHSATPPFAILAFLAKFSKNVMIRSIFRPYRLTVRTALFQGANPGAIPGGVIRTESKQTALLAGEDDDRNDASLTNEAARGRLRKFRAAARNYLWPKAR